MMKKFSKGTLTVYALLLTGIFITGCHKNSKPAPFFDGLYLKYHEVFGKQESGDIIWIREIEYRFLEMEDGSFYVSQTVNTQRGNKLDKKIEPFPYPQAGDDLTVDQRGIVMKGGDSFNFPEGLLSYLWLPPDKRKKGAEMIQVIKTVEEKMEWEGFDVLAVKGLAGDVHYYDVNTGLLVGMENFSGKLKMVLTDTNHTELKAALTKPN